MEGSKPPVSGGSGARDERAEEYFTWKGARAAVDFKGYIRNVRGVLKLSHSGILKDAGIAESLARSNPLIKQDLERMEQDLRELGRLRRLYHPDWKAATGGQVARPRRAVGSVQGRPRHCRCGRKAGVRLQKGLQRPQPEEKQRRNRYRPKAERPSRGLCRPA